MTVNGKTLRLFYSIGAKCKMDQILMDDDCRDFGTFIAKHGETYFTIVFAAALSEAYCDAHGGDPVTKDELMTLSMKEFEELDAIVAEAFALGQKRTVEAMPEKNAESTKSK